MVGGDAGRQVGLQGRAGEAAGMPLDDLSRRQRLAQNPDHARVRLEHRAHVHHLGQARNLRPRQQLADFRRLEVGAGDLESRRRRHAGGRLHDEAQGKPAARLDRIAHTFDAEHVRELVRIAENRGGALRHHHRGVVVGQHVRGFEMHMPVDEARGDDAAAHIMTWRRVARSARADARWRSSGRRCRCRPRAARASRRRGSGRRSATGRTARLPCAAAIARSRVDRSIGSVMSISQASASRLRIRSLRHPRFDSGAKDHCNCLIE